MPSGGASTPSVTIYALQVPSTKRDVIGGCRLRFSFVVSPRRTHSAWGFVNASFALKQGETVLAIGRLLGHRSPETTLKYTYLADAMVMDAAETVGAVLEG